MVLSDMCVPNYRLNPVRDEMFANDEQTDGGTRSSDAKGIVVTDHELIRTTQPPGL